MTKNINALILTNKAYAFSDRVDSASVSDNEQGLWQAQHQPETIDEDARKELWAGEIYIHLGAIAHSLSRNELPEVVEPYNPLRGVYMRTIDKILPERTGSLLPEIPGHDLGLDGLQINGGSLYTHDFLVANPDLIPEFTAKDGIADKIIKNRRRKDETLKVDTYFRSGHNATAHLQAALLDLDLIAHAFRRMDEWSALDS